MVIAHPGRLFLEKHGQVRKADDVFAYGDFLRTEAGIGDILPVDLDKIFQQFGLPQPRNVPLGNIQAILLDAESGMILVNSEDPKLRQRFSLAHELVEMLFSELPQSIDLGNGWSLEQPGGFSKNFKESLCDQTAANLLVPIIFVRQQISQYGVTFECARLLSHACQVSLTAALVQLARNSCQNHAVILWRMKNKPAEINRRAGPNQLTLFQDSDELPPKKLRVEWSIRAPTAPLIPKEKSTENASIIFKAWEQAVFTSGKERMTFNNRDSAWYFSENMPFEFDGEKLVISLIERLG